MTKTVGLMLLAAALPLACGGSSAPPATPEIRSDKIRITNPVVPAGDAAQLTTSNLAFAVDLHDKLRAQNPGNFIFSQTSISIALAMLYGGAAGTTADQMAATLHFTLPPERLHPAFNAVDLALTAPPANTDAGAFRLAIASSTWVQKGFSFVPSYLDLLAENYGAGLFVEDFAGTPDPARLAVNGWVSDNTEGKILDLFPMGSITPDTRLVLANAVFFHGDWAQPFKAGSPAGTFHAPAGDVTVPMMTPTGESTNASWWTGAGWTAAALPYAGGTTSMVLVVPDAGSFDTFERGLSADGLAAILAPTQPATALVTLPRFQFETATALNDTLKSLGMTDAFDPGAADFSGLDGNRDLSVEDVVHKAVISVDEKGTTAAAATGISVGRSSAIFVDHVLTVDRPFLFFIRHDPTGAILFEGRVVDPSR